MYDQAVGREVSEPWSVPLNNLTSLKLQGLLSWDCLTETLARSNSRLKALNLTDFLARAWEIPPVIQPSLVDGLCGVRTLVLNDTRLNRDMLERIARLLPQLTEVDLGMSTLTESDVCEFIREHKNTLQHVSIKCPLQWEFNDPNFVPWARTQGVEVKIIRMENTEQSNRVRYE